MVCDSEDAYLILYDSVNQRVRKAPHHQATFSITPIRALRDPTQGYRDCVGWRILACPAD